MISFHWKPWVARLCFIAFTVNGTHDAKAAPVDLSKPFEADKDTLCLFHLDDVGSGEVRDAVAGGKSGTVKEPLTGVLGGGSPMLRLGGHTWQSPAPNLNGLLDEVRVSSVVREYRPLPGSDKEPGGAPPPPVASKFVIEVQ